MLTAEWVKSTRSNPSGNCVEARFIKSSFSNSGPACVEVAKGDRIQVRDSKDNGEGPVLSFTREEWVAFLKGAKDNEFDIDEV